MALVNLTSTDQYALMLGKALVQGLASASNIDAAQRQIQEKDERLKELDKKFEDIEEQVKKMEKKYQSQIARLKKKLQGE